MYDINFITTFQLVEILPDSDLSRTPQNPSMQQSTWRSHSGRLTFAEMLKNFG